MTDREWERKTAVREYKAQLIDDVLNGIGWIVYCSLFAYSAIRAITD